VLGSAQHPANGIHVKNQTLKMKKRDHCFILLVFC
jgi:hypothetical protein